jgi:hypothetical protein
VHVWINPTLPAHFALSFIIFLNGCKRIVKLMQSGNRWVLLTIALVLLGIFVVVAFVLLSGDNSSENALPTLVVLNTLSPTDTESTDDRSILELSSTAYSVTVEVPSQTASPTETSLPASPSSTASPSPSASPTNTTAPSQAVNATSPSVNAATNTPSGSIVIAPAGTATATDMLITQAPSATQQGQAPIATLDPTGLVPFNQPTNVGGGSLRVLSMLAPADEIMISLGTGIPSIQSNQQWVLVELFMICDGTTNCSPALTSFSLQSNLNRYAPTPLNIESAFGSLLLGNQSLGHIAFVIPRGESPFALELNNGGVDYRFALQ